MLLTKKAVGKNGAFDCLRESLPMRRGDKGIDSPYPSLTHTGENLRTTLSAKARKSAEEDGEQRVDGNRFRKCHRDDAQSEDFAGCSGIAPYGFYGFHSNETDADSGSGSGDCKGEVTGKSGYGLCGFS